MASKLKNTFSVEGDTICIAHPSWGKLVMTSYREDYYEELSAHTWSLDKNGYPINQKLGRLHRYIMEKWYGFDTLSAFSQAGYIVDHINNEHTDCRISNLEFLKKDYNTAKGQQLDKDTVRLADKIALTIYKDFATGCYQITIGCNVPLEGHYSDGRVYMIDSLKFLYNCNYPLVLNDAEGILLRYETQGRISVFPPNCCSARVYHSPDFELSDEEKEQTIVDRDGELYLIVGNGKALIRHIPPDKEWFPADTKQVVHYTHK